MKVHILLVEDDKSLRSTLEERLMREGYRVSSAINLSGAREILEENLIDLILLDVGLPDGSGFEFVKDISKKASPPPFIFLTAMASAQDRLKGFELGAEEFIPKPFHLKELLLRINHVLKIHRRQEASDFQKAYFGDFTIDFNSFEVKHPNSSPISLTARDCGLLKLLIAERERVVSRDEILDRIWGEENFPTNRTIDNSIVRLRQILGEEGASAIKTIRSVGYRWVGQIQFEE
ncbi:MAG: response regulator transcription factor [Leptospiraceae bacterium]|nr:response regulator transcription factor [Leptospiraceae bacterium]MCP5511100.1 response regulator transcription factor [Leptospiraceae bacterium]